MTIIYTDTRNTHRIDAGHYSDLVLSIGYGYMIFPTVFDILHIDLRGDIEACTMYDAAAQRRVASFGGASAWAIYRELAKLFPDINYHFNTATYPPQRS